ncbi:(Fe-S)-binding protein [Desulfatiferula olefinivorans]
MTCVSLFIPCAVNLLLPEVGEAVRTVLHRLDLSTVYHKAQTCCGQMVINQGFRDQARGFARHFIEVFEGDQAVVCPSGSCVNTVRHQYPALFNDDARWKQRAQDLGERVFELSEFIVEKLGRTDVGARFDGTVAYHESCHIHRALGITDAPRALIRAALGTRLVPMNQADQCCGFGGDFSLDYPDISAAMVQSKVRHYLDSGADVLVTGEPGCLLNIRGFLSRHHPDKPALHLAEFLAGGGGRDGH